MRNLAIIPARSGSKGLPDKNIKELFGKPLIAFSIEAALASGVFDTVMVSTDSEKYAKISKDLGAEVPFLRSDATSTDTSSSWDVVEEVLRGYHNIGKDFDTFMLLQPTSPLRTTKNIQDAYHEMQLRNAYSIVSVCETDYSPLYCNILNDDLSLKGFIKQENKGKRRQDMPVYYRINGAIYLVYTDYFLQNHDIYREKCFAYIMDRKASIDIDEEYDFLMAQSILSIAKER